AYVTAVARQNTVSKLDGSAAMIMSSEDLHAAIRTGQQPVNDAPFRPAASVRFSGSLWLTELKKNYSDLGAVPSPTAKRYWAISRAWLFAGARRRFRP